MVCVEDIDTLNHAAFDFEHPNKVQDRNKFYPEHITNCIATPWQPTTTHLFLCMCKNLDSSN